jgi:hypothetical protein
MSAYPDENTWWNKFNDDRNAIIKAGGEQPNLGNLFVNQRVAFDIGSGKSPDDTRNSHLDSLANQVGADKIPHIYTPPTMLRASGWDVVDGDGIRYVSNDATNYLLFQRFLEGQDIEPLLYPGFTGYMVLMLCYNASKQAGLKSLIPDNYPDYYAKWDQFLTLMSSKGKRIEGCVFADAGIMNLSSQFCDSHWGYSVNIGLQHPNLKLLRINEQENSPNQMDLSRYNRPSGIFSCSGTSLAGGKCPLPGWDYNNCHLVRNWPQIYTDACPIFMIEGYAGYAGTHGPTMINETPGARETPDLWRRVSDPAIFFRWARTFSAWNGGTCHTDPGVLSQPFGPVVQQCVDGWHKGMSAQN